MNMGMQVSGEYAAFSFTYASSCRSDVSYDHLKYIAFGV